MQCTVVYLEAVHALYAQRTVVYLEAGYAYVQCTVVYLEAVDLCSVYSSVSGSWGYMYSVQ